MDNIIFSIVITTKNRIEDLDFTLSRIIYLLDRKDVECIICDDGSNDDTFEFIQQKYPTIKIFKNNISKGLIYSRNKLLEVASGTYAISLDDDLHFITENPLELIETFFQQHPLCAVITFRIFWDIIPPVSTIHNQKIERVKSFAGGAHVWRMDDWRTIPNYPDWFIFYGEEDFVSYNLFKNGKEIYYFPDVLCHHRVNLLLRKKHKDYYLRLRRSLRSGWYLYFMFYPIELIPKRLLYTIWMQIKLRVLKGDLQVLSVIFLAFSDVLANINNLKKNSNRLSTQEFKEFSKLAEVKLYWKPNHEQ